MKAKIWTLAIQHGSFPVKGLRLSAFGSREEAEAQLYPYVENWWREKIRKVIGEDMPKTQQEAVERYFKVTGETYRIDEHVVTLEPT